MVIQAIEHRHDGMVVAQCAHSGFVQRLTHIVGGCKMENLVVELVGYVEHHPREKPVILLVERRVREVCANIGADTERQQIALLVNVEES